MSFWPNKNWRFKLESSTWSISVTVICPSLKLPMPIIEKFYNIYIYSRWGKTICIVIERFYANKCEKDLKQLGANCTSTRNKPSLLAKCPLEFPAKHSSLTIITTISRLAISGRVITKNSPWLVKIQWRKWVEGLKVQELNNWLSVMGQLSSTKH